MTFPTFQALDLSELFSAQEVLVAKNSWGAGIFGGVIPLGDPYYTLLANDILTPHFLGDICRVQVILQSYEVFYSTMPKRGDLTIFSP